METVTLEANERKDTNKATRNRLRREGRVPGVFYSRHLDPIPVDVLEKTIHPMVFTAKTHLISLKIEGQEELECIIKDIQFDPVTDEILHFDLLGLTRGEKIQLEIPVQLLGSSIGVREGGLLQHLMHKVEVECLPKHIPEHIQIDISELAIGDSVLISDLTVENLTLLNPADALVVAVSHQKVVEEEVEVTEELAEGEEPAEPEVIGKGKPEEEEEEEEKESK
ncbi:MAG: 50S ribosomal protein L25 [Ignavibacteriaceae bacterium]|nr:50S ribosomal protein L25 [Ignavibacteriaceae bacterium]